MASLDWWIVGLSCLLVFAVGLWFARRATRGGLESYFAGDRDLPWWAIAISSTATYQSGSCAFVMFVLTLGLVGNWLWWASWIIWMPLVAVLWARVWQRAGVVSVAELISLRYSGTPALITRKLFAVYSGLVMGVLVIAYITGFFVQTIEPIAHMPSWMILLLFGGITVVYTMFGGLLGVVYTDVTQFIIMVLASVAFLLLAIPQHGGWAQIIDRIHTVRPDALQTLPPTSGLPMLTVLLLSLQGFFNVSDGTTAQRFLAARSEAHAVGGQLANAFLSLCIRVLPLIGLGVIGASLFWTLDLAKDVGPAPAGMAMIEKPVYVWGELIKHTALPLGFVGILVAAEVAAYMSTLSSWINYSSGMMVNDILPAQKLTPRRKIQLSRVTTLVIFAFASLVTIFFVDDMGEWFNFINATIGIFALTVGVLRFAWWRFNAWGEMAALVLSLPMSVLIWFVLGYKDQPLWQSLSILLGSGTFTLVTITLLTPPEPMETLRAFYARCRPPGFWGPVAATFPQEERSRHSGSALLVDGVLGIGACFGLVLFTNAIFVTKWIEIGGGLALFLCLGGWLLQRSLKGSQRKADA